MEKAELVIEPAITYKTLTTTEGVLTPEVMTSAQFKQDYLDLVNYLSSLKKLKEVIDKQITEVMSNNYYETGETKIVVENVAYTYIPESTREVVDSKSLKTEMPEVYKRYVKTSSIKDSVRVNVIKDKDKKEE